MSKRPVAKRPLSKSNATKSFKADGTPKKRWTAAERAAKGHGPRKSGGRPRDERESASARGRRPEGSGRGEERREHRRPEHKPRQDRSWEARDRRRDDRGFRDREDRGFRDREDRGFRGREDRGFRGRDDRENRDRDDRGFRDRDDRTNRDREDRGFRDRDDRGFRRDREDRGYRGRDDRGHARNERGFRDRDDRRFDRTSGSRDYGARNSGRREADPRDRDEFDGESQDTMSWTATELDDIDTEAVADDAGFAELGLPKVLVGALEQQGIATPFPIQTATIPDALAGKDVLGRGRTGSGKTLGFGLPLLARLANGDAAASGAPGAVVLVPTRELALQVADVLAPLAKVVGLSTTLVAGGMAFGPQIKAFDRGVDIVVATPGRLIDLMEQGVADLSQVQIAVLDEADHMADLGFMPDVTTILDAIPVGGQRLLFSATLDRGVDRLVQKYLTDPVTHEVDGAKASVTTMHHHVLHVLPHDKNATTAAIANRDGRTVVFVRTQRGADRVADQLRQAGVMAGALHGGLTQGARARILTAFKEGTVPVLVATDVAARGIHVDEVSMVLQVDPPMGPKDYLHRAGRTARAGREGHVATITLPHQRKLMRRLTGQAGVKVEPVEVRPGDDQLGDLTGARVPDGRPIGEETYQALIAPPRPVRRRGPKAKSWGRDAWDNERGGRGGRGGRPPHRRGPRV